MAFGTNAEKTSIFSIKSLSVSATKDISPFSYQTELPKNAKGNHTFAKSNSSVLLNHTNSLPGPGFYEVLYNNQFTIAKSVISNLFKPPFDSS